VICPATQLVKVLKCDRIKLTAVMAPHILFTMSNKKDWLPLAKVATVKCPEVESPRTT
jgi:hypothetical protein